MNFDLVPARAIPNIEIHMAPRSERRPIAAPSKEFGSVYTNHMFIQRYERGSWRDAAIVPFAPIPLHPSTVVFHYGQEIFEGLKAFRRTDGEINLFRADRNVARFNRSAERMCMPLVDPAFHLEALETLVSLEHEWVPVGDGESLYIRPMMFATEQTLRVKSSATFVHCILLSPAAAYYSGADGGLRVFVEEEHVRAFPGGTGECKTGGNYAASLSASRRAAAMGCDDVLWLDARERRFVEEVGSMNVAFVFGSDVIVTPALEGSILPGVTRQSVIDLADALDLEAREERMDIHETIADIRSGRITEAFGMGTAATIAPIGCLRFKFEDYAIGDGRGGPLGRALLARLRSIQRGPDPGPPGWIRSVSPRRT